MNPSFTFSVVVWAVLVGVIVAVALFRRFFVSADEDDTLHLAGEASVIEGQAGLARRLDLIDRWGKRLTVAALAYGAVLAGVYLLSGWIESGLLLGK
jgi:hypothetical protein